MLSRLGPVGLVLCLLLFANPAEARNPHQPIPTAAPRVHSETVVLRDVEALWLYVVKEGQVSAHEFTTDELTRRSQGASGISPGVEPTIEIDGYVHGMVLLSSAPLDISVNQKPVHRIRTDTRGDYRLKFFGTLNRREFWSTFLPAENMQTAPEHIQGRYSFFAKVPGDALSREPEFRINIGRPGRQCQLMIRQETRVKLSVCDLPADNPDAPDVYYLGHDLRQFKHSPADFTQRMHAIHAGIRAVENVMGGRIVDQVQIIDYQGPHNAFTCAGETDIWFYSRVFWNEPVEELRVIAEHETLHILSDKLGLPSSSRMRELFAELLAFGTFSRERFYVVATGRPPAGGPEGNAERGLSRLFDFINEKNFIRGMNGGHSQDNLDEFCVSFLHTLMYIDRLQYLLDQPIKAGDDLFITLSTGERMRLLEEYQDVLDAMLDEMPAQLSTRLTALFRTCMDITIQVAAVFEAEHNPQGLPEPSPLNVAEAREGG